LDGKNTDLSTGCQLIGYYFFQLVYITGLNL